MLVVITRLGTVAALVAGLLTASFGTAIAKNLEEHHPVSYNMEGGQGGDVTPKWSNDVLQLTRGHDVVAIQEAGPIPPMDRNGIFHWQENIRANGHTVYHYLRNFGTPDSPVLRHVYFLETDPAGHRVNLAFVTHDAPTDDQVWVTAPTLPNSRASLGVRFGQTIFNNVHGLARGHGPDIPGQIEVIDRDQRRAGYDYAVLGDFNRDPDSLHGRLPADTHVYRPGVTTHLNGGEWDYMVASRGVPLYTGHAMNGISADHLPVEFGAIPLRGAAFSLGNYHSYSARGAERILDIDRERPDNGTHILLYDNHHAGNQAFEFIPGGGGAFWIGNPVTHKCLDMRRGQNTGPGDWLNEWSCLHQSSQKWRVEYWKTDPGAAAIINEQTGDCLDVSREQNRNGSWAVIEPCNGHDSQKWTLQFLAERKS
ncbi:hypothetical protein ADK54_40495 [Streptomyces sp. WM6378]|nr:hypothetical protein ADK54_40495 [Streptomyces sp. WM6378]